MNTWTAVFCDTALHEADLHRPACKRSSSLSSSDCWQVEVKAEESPLLGLTCSQPPCDGLQLAFSGDSSMLLRNSMEIA